LWHGHLGTVIMADSHSRDAFEIPETEARWLWYGFHYWGDSAIDGRGIAYPEHGCDEAFATYSAAYDARMQETGGMSPVRLAGSCFAEGDSGRFEVTAYLLDPVDLGPVRISCFLCEDVVAGGITYSNVTRTIRDEPVVLSLPGDSGSVSLSFPVSAGWNLNNMRAYAILQRTSTTDKTIYQSSTLAFAPTSAVSEAAPCAPTLRVHPNPSGGKALLSFNVLSAMAGRSRLVVLDASGRLIRSLFEGELEPGDHVLAWDGSDDRGVRAPTGVYFVRLSTRSGATTTKLVEVTPACPRWKVAE
jgi:hypothetical protein